MQKIDIEKYLDLECGTVRLPNLDKEGLRKFQIEYIATKFSKRLRFMGLEKAPMKIEEKKSLNE